MRLKGIVLLTAQSLIFEKQDKDRGGERERMRWKEREGKKKRELDRTRERAVLDWSLGQGLAAGGLIAFISRIRGTSS